MIFRFSSLSPLFLFLPMRLPPVIVLLYHSPQPPFIDNCEQAQDDKQDAIIMDKDSPLDLLIESRIVGLWFYLSSMTQLLF